MATRILRLVGTRTVLPQPGVERMIEHGSSPRRSPDDNRRTCGRTGCNCQSHPAERRVNITLSGGKDRVSHEPVDNDERELVCDTGEDERRSGARTTRRPRPQGQSSCRRRSEHTREVTHRHRPHHIPAATKTNTTDRYGRWDRWQLPSHSCVSASARSTSNESEQRRCVTVIHTTSSAPLAALFRSPPPPRPHVHQAERTLPWED